MATADGAVDEHAKPCGLETGRLPDRGREHRGHARVGPHTLAFITREHPSAGVLVGVAAGGLRILAFAQLARRVDPAAHDRLAGAIDLQIDTAERIPP